MPINLLQFRKNDSNPWDLPTWGGEFGAGIMPLFIEVHGNLEPIGTAFMLGGHLVATAAHCINEGLKRAYPDWENRFTPGESFDIENIKFWVLHHFPLEEHDQVRVSLWPLEHIQCAPPTDVVIASLRWDEETPMLSSRLTFEPPSTGTDIFAIGCCDFNFPKGGIPIEIAKKNEFNWARDFSYRLLAAVGPAKANFTQKFAKGFGDGPACLAECPTVHGMSGGPVITSSGDTFGVISSSANFIGGSVFAHLYPLLAISVSVTARPASNIAMKMSAPFIQLVEQGLIKSDGSHGRHRLVGAENGIRVDPRVHKTHTTSFFEDIHAFLASEPAKPMPGGGDVS